MKLGDLVDFNRRHPSMRGTAGYTVFPGDYNFNKTVWIMDGIGIVTEMRDTFYRVYVYDQHLWFEDNQLKVVE